MERNLDAFGKAAEALQMQVRKCEYHANKLENVIKLVLFCSESVYNVYRETDETFQMIIHWNC